jgi:hypothetical protein
MTHYDVPSTGLSRRDLLKRGAVVGATAVWTVPLVQVVSMTPAHADSPSAPPVNPPPVTPPPVTPPPVTPPAGSHPPVAPPATPRPPGHHAQSHPSNAPHAVAPPIQVGGSAPQAGGLSALPNTGVSYPVAPTVGAGVAAIALGTGALAAAHVVKKRQESSSDA